LIQFVVAVTLAWWLLRKGDSVEETVTCVYPQILKNGVCILDPDYNPPQAVDDQFADMPETTKEEVWANDDGSVKVWKMGTLYGLLYDNGTDERYYEYYYAIGNSDGSTFRSESMGSGGTQTTRYATKELAIAKINEDEEPGSPETEPVNPNPEPQPEPGLPLKPSTGLGNSYTNISSGMGV
tara:strand:+ start:183 stop:728 length:546 start_codon:yes stop_codon:yes gene_type:complete